MRQLLDYYFYGRHRLEAIELLPLGSNVSKAIEIYGPPVVSQPYEEAPEITEHRFAIGKYHEAVIDEWKNAVQSITYWSMKADPGRDLDCILNAYGESSGWQVIEEGYWYQRRDGLIMLWCSAAPAIGVAFADFLRAKAELKMAHNLEEVDGLADATWVANDVVFELQRSYVEDGSTKLMEFVGRSNLIAASPDGRSVFIVRDHHAYDVADGFMALNCQPEPGEGYSTQVVNFFTWSADSSSWGKLTLPRDARVNAIRFDGDTCHLVVGQTKTERLLRFSGNADSIKSLSGIFFDAPYRDESLWKALEQKQAEIGDSGTADIPRP